MDQIENKNDFKEHFYFRAFVISCDPNVPKLSHPACELYALPRD
jgi:hypothetical protein